jgi:hypothetical protein
MMSKTGILNTQFSELKGLMALPRPEFCIMATVLCPASAAPLAVATASPSFAEEIYVKSGSSMMLLIKGVRKEQGTPAQVLKPNSRAGLIKSLA